jgi:hypothetical protein
VGPEWGPLSLVSTTEELPGRNSNDSSLENRDHGHRDLGGVDWIGLAQDRDKWRALTNAVMNLQVL